MCESQLAGSQSLCLIACTRIRTCLDPLGAKGMTIILLCCDIGNSSLEQQTADACRFAYAIVAQCAGFIAYRFLDFFLLCARVLDGFGEHSDEFARIRKFRKPEDQLR